MHNRKRKLTLKLTHHASGYWCKKIAGKLVYFGQRGGSEAEARKELLALIQRMEYGSAVPIPVSDETVEMLAERFAIECEARVAAGAIQPQTWQDYDAAIRSFVAQVGDTTPVRQLTPATFSTVAGRWATLSPARRGNYIQTIRSMFRWAKLAPDYGKDFVKPSRHEYRAAAKARKRLFTTADLAAMLRYASPHQRRFLLLGLNTGMYAKDMARLRWRDLAVVGDRVYVDWLRPKTKIPQHAPLWPETVAALPPRGDDGALIFTTTSGKAIVRRRVDEPARAIHRLLRRLGLKRAGVAFGAVRHTHTSAVQDCGDRDAARLVRGHAIGGMEELYDHVDLTRLAKVTEHARQRLYVEPMNTAIDPALVERMNARKPGRPPTPRPPHAAGKRVPGFPASRRAPDSGS
jgi:integrase